MLEPDQSTIAREIRRLFRKREPLNLTTVKRRHPELLKGVYAMRPFWGWRQALADADIDYTKIEIELQDHCVCRICGAEAAILTAHLRAAHQLTPDEYRQEFPGAEIMAETVRAARMRAKAALPHWEPVWSWEYVLDRVWQFHRHGWALNCIEVQRREKPLFSFIWSHGWRWDEVLQALGLEPAAIRQLAVGRHMSRAEVVRSFKRRFREGKPLAESPLGREDQRLVNAARRRFGSYAHALRAAGFDPEKVRLRSPRRTPEDIEKLGLEMLRVASLHGHARARAASALKRQYHNLVFDRLGNWKRACRKFGIPADDLAVWPYPSKKHVIDGIRRWGLISGSSLNQVKREDRPLYSAVYRFFGSWPAAMKVAEILFHRIR